MKVRITKKMLKQVSSKLAKEYIYWQECVREDYRKYHGVGVDTWHEYQKVRQKVINQLKNKGVIK